MISISFNMDRLLAGFLKLLFPLLRIWNMEKVCTCLSFYKLIVNYLSVMVVLSLSYGEKFSPAPWYKQPVLIQRVLLVTHLT